MSEEPRMPVWQVDLRQVFEAHHQYYRGVGGETLRQQLAAEGAISSQYAGRAAYELLQNALDRCDQQCLIALPTDGGAHRLLVANDGRPVSFDATFELAAHDRSGTGARGRSDFHALCSLHTSNKAADESIGNKGVGFRSVFALASRVQVWTRAPDGTGFWGLELHRSLTADGLAARRRDPQVLDGASRFLRQPLALSAMGRWPSFYFPIPLWSQRPPDPAMDAMPGLSTAVVVPLDTAEDPAILGHAEAALEELARTHLHFVGLRARGGAVRVSVARGERWETRLAALGSGDDRLAWLASWKEPTAEGPLSALARAAGHELARPGVAIGWPLKAAEVRSGLYYCYLPTQVGQPLGLDVHADFQLRIDRTALLTDPREHAGRYNRALLEVAAELHFWMVLGRLGLDGEGASDWTDWTRIQARPPMSPPPQERMDPWTFLLPPQDRVRDDPFVEALQRLLFGAQPQAERPETYGRWAKLAGAFFCEGVAHERASYDTFWEATARWVDRLTGTERRLKAWRRAAKAACASLRATGARIIPLIDGGEPELETPGGADPAPAPVAVPLPDDREGVSGTRADRRVFLRQGGEEEAGPLVLPEALLERGRSVTGFTFPSGIAGYTQEVTGVTDFRLLDLLRELRQLPVVMKEWRRPGDVDEAERERLVARQRMLLRFAAQLYVARAGQRGSLQERAFGPGWRAYMKGDAWSDDLLRAGRAVATLFLPCQDGTWAPARQLMRAELCQAWVGELEASVGGLEVESFLTFLGVSREGLMLVEGGERGLVDSCQVPPPLVDTEREATDPVEIVWPDGWGPTLEAVEAAWADLKPLLEAEQAGTLNGRLRHPLASSQWFPAARCDAPAGPPAKLSLLAPQDVTLRGPTPDRRYAVLWTYPQAGPLSGLLAGLGAVPGLSDSVLQEHSAAPAHRLWKQLESLDLEALAESGKARQAALELFQAVLEAVARAPDPAAPRRSVLTFAPAARDAAYGERALEWRSPGAEAWICRDNGDRDRLRGAFFQLPLVTATLGADQVRSLPWLAERAIRVEEAIEPSPRVEQTSAWVEALRQELEQLLPGLFAMAEASRLLPEVPSPADLAERWHGLRICHVERVALTITASPTGQVPLARQIYDDATDDVLLDPKAKTILFDTAAGSERLPPLQSFADALSLGVLGNPVLGGVWGQAIAAYELALTRHPEHSPNARRTEAMAAFRSFLRRRNAASLEDIYARCLKPLTEEGRMVLHQKVESALALLGIRLKPGASGAEGLRRLAPEDLEPPAGGWGELREANVQDALATVAWTEVERSHRVSFECTEQHCARWNQWLRHARRGERLQALAAELVEKSSCSVRPPAASLEALAEGQLSRLGFEPVVTVLNWLRLQEQVPDWIADINDDAALDARLPAPATKFTPIKGLADAGARTMVPRPLVRRPPMERQLEPLAEAKIRAGELSRSATGAEAEAAFLPFVVSRTREVLAAHPEEGWKALLKAVEPGTPIFGRLQLAYDQGAKLADEQLAGALHVSEITDSVGYDMLGLETEPESGAPLLVRYECKAASREGPLELHVSTNELAAFARWRLGQFAKSTPAHGIWRLVAIGRGGLAQDLSDLLVPLAESGGLADVLAAKGFAADSWILSVGGPT